MKGVEYRGVMSVDGPIVVVKRTENISFSEVVYVRDRFGEKRTGRVIDLSEDTAVVQIFGSTTGLDLDETTVEFLEEPLELRVGEGLLGRIFNGLGEPIDGYAPIVSSKKINVNGYPINPYARVYPRDFIQTGISSIDGMNTLIRGQKLPIFSGNGLPHNRLAAQIIRQARLRSSDDQFVMVFAGMGIKYDVAKFFQQTFEESGVLSKVVMFQSLADAPSIERIVTPRCALTAAEYLAYEKGMHVLVVLTDMTNYCEALREISTTLGEVPGRKGYPGYLYSDLAEIYERAGKVKGSEGSITQIPILSMPNDDISHPIPDLTGYITEGQIVLDRELNQKGMYPPVAGLPSLSRLMKDGIGEGMTRDDHANLSSQLFSAYSKVKSVRNLAAIIGEEELSEIDRMYLKFGEHFESEFLTQGEYENRSIEETLTLGWKMLKYLPVEELVRVTPAMIEKYLPKDEEDDYESGIVMTKA
ncbi:MAG: V-type ATP synthase subunit B [Treponema sp.]|nr:V-type ATP synthase subunit B [Treponema sp.]